jgi:hypothetical protein
MMSVETIEGLNAYELARYADCASPDGLESPGAKFLEVVRDVVVDAITDEDTPEEDRHDSAFAIADASVPIYTYDKWQAFVDLAAWQEDPSELGFDGTDMEQGAGICLMMVGERLARALFEEADDDDDDEEDE